MISLISEVTSLYFQLLDYDNRLEISRSTLVVRQEYLNIIQERFNKGIVPEIDLNQAQIQEAIAAAGGRKRALCGRQPRLHAAPLRRALEPTRGGQGARRGSADPIQPQGGTGGSRGVRSLRS